MPRPARRKTALLPWFVTPVVVLTTGLVVSTAWLILQVRQTYFFGDEWAFLVRRDLSFPGLFEPHNEHWSTLPLISFRMMYHLFGIDHHLAYGMGPVILHVAICVVSYVLLRRFGTAAWPATLVTLLLAFLAGNIGQNPVWAFQIGFLGSALAGLLAILAWDAVSRPVLRYALVWLAAVVSLMSSGMALPMLVLLGATCLFLQGFRAALLATVPPLLVYLAWFLAYGRDGRAQTDHVPLQDVMTYAWTGASSIWEQVLRFTGSGGAVLAALVVTTLVLPMPDRRRRHALAGLVTLAAMYLLLGYSRAGFGASQATVGRYAYFGVILTIPAAAAAVEAIGTRMGDRPRERAVVFAAVAVLLAVSGAAQLQDYRTARMAVIPDLEQRVLGARDLVATDPRLLGDKVDPTVSPDITATDLADPEIVDALPDRRSTAQGRLDAAVFLQVAVADTNLRLAPADKGLSLHNITGTFAPTGCSTLYAESYAAVDLVSRPTGVQVRLSSPTPTYTVVLMRGEQTSIPRSLPEPPGRQLFFGTTASDATMRIKLSPGPVTICRD